MSAANVELVRRFFECWTNQDFDAALQCADARVSFDWSESQSPYRGLYTGHDGLMQFRKEMEEAFDDFAVEMVDAIPLDGERLVTEMRRANTTMLRSTINDWPNLPLKRCACSPVSVSAPRHTGITTTAG